MMSLSSLSPLLIILLRTGREVYLQHPHCLQKSLVCAIVLHLGCVKNLRDLSCKSIVGADQRRDQSLQGRKEFQWLRVSP